jgi:hypothetical protein
VERIIDRDGDGELQSAPYRTEVGHPPGVEVVLGRSHDGEGGLVGEGHRLLQPHNSFEVFFSPVLSSPQARVSHTPVISTHAWANKSARFELSS